VLSLLVRVVSELIELFESILVCSHRMSLWSLCRMRSRIHIYLFYAFCDEYKHKVQYQRAPESIKIVNTIYNEVHKPFDESLENRLEGVVVSSIRLQSINKCLSKHCLNIFSIIIIKIVIISIQMKTHFKIE